MAPVLRARERSAIVLAGGEGTRLKTLTRRITGEEIPKQFCRLIGSKTLLEQTRDRVSSLIPADRTVTVVTRAHERFYQPVLNGVPRHLIVAQPKGRGTAPAILYALMRLSQHSPTSVVSIFPSDHYVSDDSLFMHHIDVAARAVDMRPELTILLGIEPTHPEPSYGWIEPTDPLVMGETPFFRVRRFIEKPDMSTASRLMSKGALWNSFVMVARASTMIGLFMMATPGLYVAFNSVRATFDTALEPQVIDRLYKDIPEVNFSSAVLEECPVNLAVMPVRQVQWSDLGDPNRVLDTWNNTGFKPQWVGA